MAHKNNVNKKCHIIFITRETERLFGFLLPRLTRHFTYQPPPKKTALCIIPSGIWFVRRKKNIKQYIF